MEFIGLVVVVCMMGIADIIKAVTGGNVGSWRIGEN